MGLPEASNRRNVSGHRVIARCKMELPKKDMFSNYKNIKESLIVFNARGGCFYLLQQLNKNSIEEIFPSDKPIVLPKLTIFSKQIKEVNLVNVSLKYEQLRHDIHEKGIIFRFLRLSDDQLDALNKINGVLPKIAGEEGKTVQAARKLIKHRVISINQVR